MCFPDTETNYGDDARAEEEARQQRIAEGRQAIQKAFAGYNDDFYNQRKSEYIDYATPQIQDQYQQSMGDLAAALSRKGLLRSSVGAEKRALANYTKNQALVDAQQKGQQYADSTRSNIDQAKAEAESQNLSFADPARAAQQAIASARAASAVPEYSPLAELFKDVTALGATQAELERRDKNQYNILGMGNDSSKIYK
jgi:hypothetical protein